MNRIIGSFNNKRRLKTNGRPDGAKDEIKVKNVECFTAFVHFKAKKTVSGIGDLNRGKSSPISGIGELSPGNSYSISGVGELSPGNISPISGVGELSPGNSSSISGVGELSPGNSSSISGVGELRGGNSSLIPRKSSPIPEMRNKMPGKQYVETKKEASSFNFWPLLVLSPTTQFKLPYLCLMGIL